MEELQTGMEQLDDMAQNLNVEAALELDAAQLQAEKSLAPSFDMNSVVGGGFGEPSAPAKPNITGQSNKPSDFMAAMNQVIDTNADDIFVQRDAPKTLEEKLNPVVGPKTRYAGKDIDMFRYQEDFDQQGFNYFNAEKSKGYIEHETWSSALGKGLDSFATRFGNTFTDSFASYGRMFDALFNGDWSRLKYSEDEMIEANYKEHLESMKNFVFVSPEEEDDIWSKRSVSEFIGNAGFALGTFAALGVELVGDAILTAATGGAGAGSFLGTAARFGAREAVMTGAKVGLKSSVKGAAFKFADFVADMGRGAYHFSNQSADALSAAGKVANQANQAKKVANATKVGSSALRETMKEVFDIYTLNVRGVLKSKTFAELSMNIAKGTPLLGTGVRYGEKIAAGAKGGLSTGKLVGIGLQGGRRMIQEFNMSSTEANFEAISGYGSTLDLMVDQYRADHNGENPPASEFAKMKDLAMRSASASYNTNLGILLITNKLQFGSIFNRFAGANKFTKEIMQEGAENVLGVNRMWKSSKLVGKTYEKGFLGTYGLAGKIAKDFGRKQALYEIGKQASRDILRFEVSEGLQENLQEMTGSAWKNYYAGLYNGTKYTISEAFEKGLDEQFTKQGFRTFLQGALTGSLIRPVTHTVGKMTSYMQEKSMERAYKDNPSENPYVKMREQLKRDINLTNSLMTQLSNKKLEDNIINFTTQIDSHLRQTEAAAKGLQYEWQNAKDNALLAGVLAANRTGTIAMYQQAIREMGKTMTNEEFEAAFGVKLEDTKYATAAEFTESVAKDVKKYSDTIDTIRKNVGNMPDPLMYEKGSKDRLVATIIHNAQEEAIKVIALNAMKATRASERAEKVAQDLLKIPGFASSSEYALRALTNPEMFKSEKGNIQAEIKLLEESLKALTPEQKKNVEEKIKTKQKTLEVYDKWLGFWDSREQLLKRENDEGDTGEVKELVRDTFIGVPFKVDEYDEDGKLIKKDSTVYSLDHNDMIETFREFINLRNKEAGNNSQISEQDLRQAFDKIVDFIRLDQDAKDYMQAMDMMYNPEYYRKVVANIQDGRFKYELLEFVDTINQRVFDAVLFTVKYNSDVESLEERLELAAKLFEELTDAINGSDAYKNLVQITVDDKLGLDHAKFAEDNVKILNELIEEKIAGILDTYAPNVMSNEVSDEDYANFQKTKKASGLLKTVIARRIAAKATLTDKQSEIYKAFEKEIDAIVERLGSTVEGVTDSTLLNEAKEALIKSGEFGKVELDNMTKEDVLKLALERNLIEQNKVEKEYENEVISDEIYNQFKTTNQVDDSVLESIALKDLEQIDLSPREKEIMGAFLAEITDKQNAIEDERKRAEEENEPAEESQDEEVPQVFQQEDDTQEKTTDPLENMGGQMMDTNLLNAINAANGTGTSTENNESSEPFSVSGDDQTGFNVNSRNGTTVNTEPLDTATDAESLAEELNVDRNNLEWANTYMGDLTAFEDASSKVSNFISRAKRSLAAYNKKQPDDKKIKTLSEYNNIPEGREVIRDIKESVLTGKSLEDIRKERAIKKPQVVDSPDLFDTPSSEFGTGPALPLQPIQELYDRLEAMDKQPTAPVSNTTKKADIERKHTFTRDSLKEISDGTGLAKKGTVILNSDKVSSQLNVGDKITFYAERERTGVWDGKAIREDKSNNPFGILAVLSSTDAYIKNQSAIDAELDALEGAKPAVTPSVSDKKANIENQINAVKNAKTKEELIKASEQLIGMNPYDAGAVSMGTRAALMTPSSFERGKELFLQEVKEIIETKKQAELKALDSQATQSTEAKKADIERRIVELQKRLDEDKYEKEKEDILNSLTKGFLPTGFRFGSSIGIIEKYISEEDRWISVVDNIMALDKDHIKAIDKYFNQQGLGQKISNANTEYKKQIKPFEEKEEQEDKDITNEQIKLLSTKEGILIRKDWSLGKGLGYTGEGTNGIVEIDEDKNGNKFEAEYYLTGENDEWIESSYFLGKTKQEVIDKINAKYDAELDAASTQSFSQKSGTFVKEEQVSEDSVLDQLRKINSCFK